MKNCLFCPFQFQQKNTQIWRILHFTWHNSKIAKSSPLIQKHGKTRCDHFGRGISMRPALSRLVVALHQRAADREQRQMRGGKRKRRRWRSCVQWSFTVLSLPCLLSRWSGGGSTHWASHWLSRLANTKRWTQEPCDGSSGSSEKGNQLFRVLKNNNNNNNPHFLSWMHRGPVAGSRRG